MMTVSKQIVSEVAQNFAERKTAQRWTSRLYHNDKLLIMVQIADIRLKTETLTNDPFAQLPQHPK